VTAVACCDGQVTAVACCDGQLTAVACCDGQVTAVACCDGQVTAVAFILIFHWNIQVLVDQSVEEVAAVILLHGFLIYPVHAFK
jgi:hypothetical protein